MPTSILFVDDEPDFEQLLRLTYRRQLQRQELEFEFARDGVEALAKIEARSFDLIVTDINMAGLNGLELVRELVRRGCGIPVIVASAYGNMDNIQAAMDAGAFDYLTKPIDFEALDKARDRAVSSCARDAGTRPAEDTAARTRNELSELGLLVAGVVHELKNPLSFISTFAKLSDELLDELRAQVGKADVNVLRGQIDELELTMSKILRHSDWALSIVGSILDGTASAPREIDVNTLIAAHVDLFAASMRVKYPSLDVSIDKQLDPDVGPVLLPPQQIIRALVNLLENAYHALRNHRRDEGAFTAQIRVETRVQGEFVELCIVDNGPGIPAEIRAEIFDPFLTTKEPHEGSGLGLHLVARLVGDCGGQVSVEDDEPGGTRVRMLLPTL
jgi:two-component system NtrC family sensor kinase